MNWEKHCENLLEAIEELSPATNPYEVLKAADKILNGHGVETVCRGNGSDGDALLDYVNTGESYAPTLAYDYLRNEYCVTSWADFAESAPQAEDYYESAAMLAQSAFVLAVDGSAGRHVAKQVATHLGPELLAAGLSAEDLATLGNPDNEHYDDIWSEVLEWHYDLIVEGKPCKLYQAAESHVFLVDVAKIEAWEESMEANFWDYYID